MQVVTIVDQLHSSLPELTSFIRKSRRFKHATVIARGPFSERTLLCSRAADCGEDYHLCTVVRCRPATVDSDPDVLDAAELELRPAHWYQLKAVIIGFLDGQDADALLDLARA